MTLVWAFSVWLQVTFGQTQMLGTFTFPDSGACELTRQTVMQFLEERQGVTGCTERAKPGLASSSR